MVSQVSTIAVVLILIIYTTNAQRFMLNSTDYCTPDPGLITDETNGRLRSQSSSSYSPSANADAWSCGKAIKPADSDGSFFLVQFMGVVNLAGTCEAGDEFKIEKNADNELVQKYCGENVVIPAPLEIDSNHLIFTMSGPGGNAPSAAGFCLTYSMFRNATLVNETLTCADGNFTMMCDVYRCMPESYRCDGISDCIDGVDEFLCGDWWDKNFGKILDLLRVGLVGLIIIFVVIMLLILSCIGCCIYCCCCRKRQNRIITINSRPV